MSLTPTPTRLALLADVGTPRVWRMIPNTYWRRYDDTKPRLVTAQAQEMRDAGWVEPNPARTAWRRTEFGDIVLAQHRRAEP